MKRKRSPGRKIYSQHRGLFRSDNVQIRSKAERTREDIGRGRLTSPASLAARERAENHKADKIINTLGMNRGGDNKPREEALNALERYVRLDQMDNHAVVRQGSRTVLMLFWNSKARKTWFVERNLITGVIRRSINYGSVSQAFEFHKHGVIRFVE